MAFYLAFRCTLTGLREIAPDSIHSFNSSGKKRYVPINPVLKRLLQKLKREQRGAFVFCDMEGAPLDAHHLYRDFQIAQRKAHFDRLIRFHDLRHTFAVVQLEARTDLDTLKRLLRHSKIGITSDYYLHNNITLIRKASAVMDNVVKIKCAKSVTKEEKKG